jgi:hypothetical protein
MLLGFGVFLSKTIFLELYNFGEALEDNKKSKAYAYCSYAWEVTLF